MRYSLRKTDMDLDFLKDGETPPVALPPPKVKNVGKLLTEKIKSLIYWTGLICASISVVAYILIVVVMCVGFSVSASFSTNLIFALISAFVGILIMQFMKLQGIAFAKSEDEVKEVWDKFYKKRTKKRKVHSVRYFWVKSISVDIIVKAISIIITSVGTLYVFIEASGDVMRILLAIFNLTLFAGFGMMGLTQAYDFIRDEHLAWMLQQLEEKEENENVEQIKENIANSGAAIQIKSEKEHLAETASPDCKVGTACDSDNICCLNDTELIREPNGNNTVA